MSLEVYVITFDHEKMTLRVPTAQGQDPPACAPLAEGYRASARPSAR